MYFVKETAIATKDNKNFAGCVHTYIYGKSSKLIEAHTSECDPWIDREFSPWLSKEYGYRRKCDAMRNWTYKNAKSERYWDCEVEIIWKDC